MVAEKIEDLRAAILELIRRGADQPSNDRAFNELALRQFTHQFAMNAPYRKFCQRRGKTPDTVRNWREVPPVPIAAFKELALASQPVEEAVACFMTSGTTNPEKRGKHYHFSLEVYDASASTFFKANVLPDVERMRLLILGSPPDLMPNSSLSHYLGVAHRYFGSPGSRFYIGADGLQTNDFASDLRAAERSGEPICLLGASFAFVHFLDGCRADGLRFRLPPGSRIMDTGGFKGRSREVPQEELYAALTEVFCVPTEQCINMYGMTELSMQCYDSPVRRRALGLPEERQWQAPPWARTVVLDADSLAPVAPGERGIICHYDLANCSSVIGILTEDVGVTTAAGFRLLGRVKGAEARGCSVSVDEMLTVAGQGSA
jgi:acyl-protein synthetase LuxE